MDSPGNKKERIFAVIGSYSAFRELMLSDPAHYGKLNDPRARTSKNFCWIPADRIAQRVRGLEIRGFCTCGDSVCISPEESAVINSRMRF